MTAIGRPRPPETPGDTLTYIIGGLLIILLLGGYAGCAEYLYGDWRCAFAQCRIETK